jgi:hypothetical protein
MSAAAAAAAAALLLLLLLLLLWCFCLQEGAVWRAAVTT